MNLNKWGIEPNFKPKHAIIKVNNKSKKNAKFAIIPKNGKSFPLSKKAKHPFKFKKKKYTYTIIGSYTIGTGGKRNILLTSGFQLIVAKKV